MGEDQLGALAPDGDGSALTGIVAVPVGAMTMYAGASVPTGWLFCDAAAVSRTTYSALFAAVGTTYGVGDGATTFNVPDMRGRVPLGVGTGDAPDATAHALGSKAGAETHTLLIAEMPAHTHNSLVGGTGLSDGSGNHTYKPPGSLATGSAGGDGAHNNLQPSLTLNCIIVDNVRREVEWTKPPANVEDTSVLSSFITEHRQIVE